MRAGSARTSGSPRSAVRRSNLCSISCSLSSTRAPDPSRPCGRTQCADRETVLQRRAAPGGYELALDTKVVFAKPPAHDCDLLAVLVPQGALGDEKISDAHFGDLDRALSGLLKRVAAEEEFSGKEGQSLSLHTHEKKGATLGAYVFDRYKQEKKPLKLASVHLLAREERTGRRGGGSRARAPLAQAAELGCQIADATNLARDLVNEPAGRITPKELAGVARKVARDHKLKIEVLGRPQIERLKMDLFLGVAQGSAEEPQLVRLSYVPAGKAAARAKGVALVGKAITFDSGGLSIKTAQGMENMKTDMAGAAAIIAAMSVVAETKPPFPVDGYFGACENLPSGTAYKPGDVLVGRNGTSVEVLNTDAEGRLVLGDVLAWACEREPAAVIDLATLTGAILVALGPWMMGLFSNDDALAGEILSAADAAGEPIWRMPLPRDMEELIKSPIADLKNTGGRNGGSINAGLFLQHFVGKTPWVHLDIAGPSALDKERGYNPRGGTGAGVRLLVEWLRRRSARTAK
ncbi:MAG: leucyl aminopeptidase [Deltaproteobacteria bacterium]|nr:MAG: leucyl aminopeptidase [Deltaproteobacteria bacterium]